MTPAPLPDLKKLNPSWTLFLDRDGVINIDKKGEYIHNWSEFHFYENIPGLMAILSKKFDRIIVVSNQRGIGKGLMTELDLQDIHKRMQEVIEKAGGRIDRIYFATSVDRSDPDLKPNAGMAFRAKKEFPSIDFSKSLMVGNKLTDMEFGRKAGIFTVFIATTDPEVAWPHPDIDFRFDNLAEFVKAL